MDVCGFGDDSAASSPHIWAVGFATVTADCLMFINEVVALDGLRLVGNSKYFGCGAGRKRTGHPLDDRGEVLLPVERSRMSSGCSQVHGQLPHGDVQVWHRQYRSGRNRESQ